MCGFREHSGGISRAEGKPRISWRFPLSLCGFSFGGCRVAMAWERAHRGTGSLIFSRIIWMYGRGHYGLRAWVRWPTFFPQGSFDAINAAWMSIGWIYRAKLRNGRRTPNNERDCPWIKFRFQVFKTPSPRYMKETAGQRRQPLIMLRVSPALQNVTEGWEEFQQNVTWQFSVIFRRFLR